MPQKPTSFAEAFRIARPKRLRNTLVSLLICAGLIVAYYLSLGSTPLPSDLRIAYQAHACGGPCPAFRIEIDASGDVVLQNETYAWRYRISQFALRRLLRAYDQAHFLTRDISAYSANKPPVCDLSLRDDHRFLSLRHTCGTDRPEIAGPVTAIETVTQFQEILAGNAAAARDHHAIRSALHATDEARYRR
jgi:hypothetical protein